MTTQFFKHVLNIRTL